MSRRARGFAVWAVLMALGRQGVAEMVERHCAVARAIAARLAAEPGIAVLNEVVLNQVAVACGEGAEGDAQTRAVLAAVQAEGDRLPEPRALARARDRARSRSAPARRRWPTASARRGDLAAWRRVRGRREAPVIEARGLGLTFETADGPVHALKDVNLRVGKGDFVSFIGPSGCGKTTFLRVAADLETPTDGTITVNGMSPAEARRGAGLRLRVPGGGAVPLADDRRNVRLPLEIMGFGRAEQAARTARVLDLVELGGFERKFPWQLSGGMQQRRRSRGRWRSMPTSC